jgi:hypothetical protein
LLSKDSQLKPIQADIYNWLRLQSETDRFVRDRQQGERERTQHFDLNPNTLSTMMTYN